MNWSFNFKKKNYIIFKHHKLYISNKRLIDNFKVKYSELYETNIEEIKRLLFRWLKEKNLFSAYVHDSNCKTNHLRIFTIFDLFVEQKKNSTFWIAVEYAFFNSFKK